MGVNGRSTVRDSPKLEQIVGSPDMTSRDRREAEGAPAATIKLPKRRRRPASRSTPAAGS
jgi:hypothetical protein